MPLCLVKCKIEWFIISLNHHFWGAMIIGIADVLFLLFAFAGLYFLHLTTRALKIRASFVGIGVGVGNRKLATYVLMSLLCAGLSYGFANSSV